jgi:hypothetical protein
MKNPCLLHIRYVSQFTFIYKLLNQVKKKYESEQKYMKVNKIYTAEQLALQLCVKRYK